MDNNLSQDEIDTLFKKLVNEKKYRECKEFCNGYKINIKIIVKIIIDDEFDSDLNKLIEYIFQKECIIIDNIYKIFKKIMRIYITKHNCQLKYLILHNILEYNISNIIYEYYVSESFRKNFNKFLIEYMSLYSYNHKFTKVCKNRSDIEHNPKTFVPSFFKHIVKNIPAILDDVDLMYELCKNKEIFKIVYNHPTSKKNKSSES